LENKPSFEDIDKFLSFNFNNLAELQELSEKFIILKWNNRLRKNLYAGFSK